MTGWAGGNPGEDEAIVQRREQSQRRALAAIPKLREWYLKGLSGTVPGIVAAVVGMVATGSAGIAALAATAVTAVCGPAMDHWFKRREIKAQLDAGDAEADADPVVATTSSIGALGAIMATISAAISKIGEADEVGHQSFDSLRTSRDRLATVIGGGEAIPPLAEETYVLNDDARRNLEAMHAALENAVRELQKVQVVLE